MKPDGTVKSEFTPKFSDGRHVDTLDGVKASPDGRLWACDGDCLVRLNDQGIVDLVLGQAPQVETLSTIAGIAVDRQGRIHAVDKKTGSIHVFDGTGKLQHLCKARPDDFKGTIFDPAVTVNDRGEVYLGLGGGFQYPDNKREFAHFSDNGQRLENVAIPASLCHFQSGTDNLVALHGDHAMLVDRLGKVIRTIRRRPDGNWLVSLGNVALGSDGSVAIVSEQTVNLYESNGDPIRTISLPEAVGRFPRIAYDGNQLVIAGDCGLLHLDKTGTSLEILTTAQWKDPQQNYWKPFLVADGRELLLFDRKSSTIHRYEMP